MANRPTIVSTVFGGGGDEQLKVTDVYKAESGSDALLNDYVSSVTQGSNDMLSRLKGDNTSLSDLVDLIDIEDGAIKGNQNAIGRRAERAAGIDLSSKRAFMDDFKRQMLDIASDATGVGFGGDITGSASEFTEFVNDLLKSDLLPPVVDDYVNVAMIGSLIGLAIELELPEAIDKLLDKIDDDKAKKKALIANLERVARAADLPNLRKIRGWIGAAEMYARLPNIVQLIMAGFRLKTEEDETPNYGSIYNELIELFDSLDPEWSRRDRLGEPISFIGYFAHASEDTLAVFTQAGIYRTEAMIAKSYPTNQLRTMIRQHFPQSPAGKWLTVDAK